MFALARRRGVVLVAVVFAGLGVGTVLAVQAGASGSSAPPQPAAVPTAPPPPAAGPLQPRTVGGAITPQAAATNAHCGQTVTASLTLNGDLFCNGAGLIIAGNSINLNLGGHTIAGPGTGVTSPYGVDVRGTSDTVQNGVVTNFYVGVYVKISGKTDTILNVRAMVDGFGLYDEGTGTKITTSVATKNNYGISSFAVGSTYSGDHEVSNLYSGFYIGGSKLVVSGNIANGNQDGIFDQGVGTTLTKNIANFNTHDGIDVYDTTVIDGGGNTAKGNDYGTGAVPQQCFGIVCT
jgi:hypothetical protein